MEEMQDEEDCHQILTDMKLQLICSLLKEIKSIGCNYQGTSATLAQRTKSSGVE